MTLLVGRSVSQSVRRARRPCSHQYQAQRARLSWCASRGGASVCAICMDAIVYVCACVRVCSFAVRLLSCDCAVCACASTPTARQHTFPLWRERDREKIVRSMTDRQGVHRIAADADVDANRRRQMMMADCETKAVDDSQPLKARCSRSVVRDQRSGAQV